MQQKMLIQMDLRIEAALCLKKTLKSYVEMMQIVEVPIKVAVTGGGKLDHLQDF